MKEHYSLAEPFDIDDGQLDGLTPQEVFCLGVEWQMVRQSLEHGERFERVMHIENRDRVAALLQRHNRKHNFTFMHDDGTEAWVNVTVDERE